MAAKGFDLKSNSCHECTPYGLLYEWLAEVDNYGAGINNKAFWNIILYTKNEKAGYYSYVIKYFPTAKQVMIKAAPQGG
eukprot:14999286-Heterocapsa_arctica.AAC.1